MNKSEFVSLLSKRVELPKSYCAIVLDGIQSAIKEVLSKGDEVSIRGFGKFKVVERAARKCSNPVTKRTYFAKPKRAVVFKGYKTFKYCL